MLALCSALQHLCVCVGVYVRPAAAVSRCVVQFILSSPIPSGPGLLKWFEPKEVRAGMLEDIKLLSSPVDRVLPMSCMSCVVLLDSNS